MKNKTILATTEKNVFVRKGCSVLVFFVPNPQLSGQRRLPPRGGWLSSQRGSRAALLHVEPRRRTRDFGLSIPTAKLQERHTFCCRYRKLQMFAARVARRTLTVRYSSSSSMISLSVKSKDGGGAVESVSVAATEVLPLLAQKRCAGKPAFCFDVDSTVITSEGIDVLADHCGAGEAVAAW